MEAKSALCSCSRPRAFGSLLSTAISPITDMTAVALSGSRPLHAGIRPKELRLRSHSFADFRAPDRLPAQSPRSFARSPAVLDAATFRPLETGIGDLGIRQNIGQDSELYDARFQPWSPRKVHDLSAIPQTVKRLAGSSDRSHNPLFGDGVVGITGLSNLGNTVCTS